MTEKEIEKETSGGNKPKQTKRCVGLSGIQREKKTKTHSVSGRNQISCQAGKGTGR